MGSCKEQTEEEKGYPPEKSLLFGKTQDQIDSLIKTVHLFSSDIGMVFGIDKCGVVIMKRGKLVECNGVELPMEKLSRKWRKMDINILGCLS